MDDSAYIILRGLQAPRLLIGSFFVLYPFPTFSSLCDILGITFVGRTECNSTLDEVALWYISGISIEKQRLAGYLDGLGCGRVMTVF